MMPSSSQNSVLSTDVDKNKGKSKEQLKKNYSDNLIVENEIEELDEVRNLDDYSLGNNQKSSQANYYPTLSINNSRQSNDD